MLGSEHTRLVVLRGNSGSGRSTVAQLLRSRLGRGAAWVEQDHFRRAVLAERDRLGAPNIGLIDQTVRYALNAGYHVVVEGILPASHYESMIRTLALDHVGATGTYFFDIPLEETVARHRTRLMKVSEDTLRGWYVEHDLLSEPRESIIGPELSADATVNRIIDDMDIGPAPIRDRILASDHLDPS